MERIKKLINQSSNRFEFWSSFIQIYSVEIMAELGVYKGEFAEFVLKECIKIEKYYMIDPWRNLENWNKPTNTNSEEFELFYRKTLNRTNFASEKRVILRGKTTEVMHKINDSSLDFVYIDGDHTLKGITIDLTSLWDKVRPDGFIAGDDFCSTIWQHDKKFEPTFVFPFAVYFAEAKNVKIFALPFNQFLICKGTIGFELIDLTNGRYKDTSILSKLKIETTKRQTFISKFLKNFE